MNDRRTKLPPVIIDGVVSDDNPTLVPCACCAGRGMVTPAQRAEQRARAGVTKAVEHCDEERKDKP